MKALVPTECIIINTNSPSALNTCFDKCFCMENIVTLFPGKMVFILSSNKIFLLSLGSCKSLALIYSHSFFTTWVRGQRSRPRKVDMA